jgi:parallel beta-helix repeat protein
MYKLTFIFGIILMLVISAFIPISLGLNVKVSKINPPIKSGNGNTLYVGGIGPNNYTSIQDAINDAVDGNTVFVYDDSSPYYESVNIDKSINLIGEDKYTTIIDGEEKIARVVKLNADGITFSGFSVMHSRDWANDAGIYIYTSNNVVKDNIITDNSGGEGSIVVDGDYNEIINNIITNNDRDYSNGIFVAYKDDYNIISGNTINNHNWGIWIAANQHNVVDGNHISNNSQEGIMIRGVENCEIHNNILENNDGAAISIESDSSNVYVYTNEIRDNGKGLLIKGSVSISVSGNSFQTKGIQLKGGKINYWTSHRIYGNTINGRPIYYFESEYDLDIPIDTGQLILADCNNCIVENLDISNVDYAIQVGYSNEINIFSNEFDNIIENCITIYASSNNRIDENIIHYVSGNGIGLGGSSLNNKIIKNSIKHNYRGIKIGSKSSLNFISNNNFIANENSGVYLDSSENNEIYRNNFQENRYGVLLDFAYNNSITDNNFINNGRPGSFILDYRRIHDNTWDSNYYGFSFGILPKLLLGLVKSKYYWEYIPGEIVYILLPGLNFDWHPARQPYDI